MPDSYTIAGDREAGVLCPHCDVEIEAGDKTRACRDCGNVQHWTCWRAADGCGAWECAPDTSAQVDSGDVLRISRNEIETAQPLAPAGMPAMPFGPTLSIPIDPMQRLRWNKMAIASLVVAVIGIPGFGIVTGLIAVVLGAIALAGKWAFRHRGAGLAVAAILLGIGDFIGWSLYLYSVADPQRAVVALDDFEPDPLALEELPPHINRAMKANVLIQTNAGLFSQGIGSGVILSIRDGSALVVTNRHVVDPDFGSGATDIPDDLSTVAGLVVKMVGQPAVAAQLAWLAPHGVDMALVDVPVLSIDPLPAWWEHDPATQVGDRVFAVGNPHGLGWTHTGGEVSQFRRQQRGNQDVRVIQTSAAINPGNSGGGLYSEEGWLIGINTWTNDKRVAEGLGFAISFKTLLDLTPPRFELPAVQLND